MTSLCLPVITSSWYTALDFRKVFFTLRRSAGIHQREDHQVDLFSELPWDL